MDSNLPDGRDALTGLTGPDGARRRLAKWLGQGPVHAILVGLPRLNSINLAYGHHAGDALLVEVAARLAHYLGNELDSPWFAARMGGGTFLIAAREACSRERWVLVAEGLADSLARPIHQAQERLHLAPRLALLRVLEGEDAASVFDRLGQAQSALSRGNGRRISWVDGGTVKLGRSAAQLEADLARAIHDGGDGIEVLFQPQYAGADQKLCGAEALARWPHPELGRLGAGALFAVADRADLTAQLSLVIARRAMRIARSWPTQLRLSINVTAADLATGDFPAALAGVVAETGFDPGRLTLEITEQALLADMELARHSLARLSAQGMRIALDDFGAGFCNFHYLKILPLDYLKLDRTMIEGIADDPRDLAVLRGIVAMARALGLQVLAEGVETPQQRDLALHEGCAAWQGFLGSEPVETETFLNLLAA